MDAQTIAFYDACAPELVSYYAGGKAGADRWFGQAFPLGRFKRILDVGTGTGRDLCALLRGGYDAAGCEPSAGMRQQAEKLLDAAGLASAGRLFRDGLPELASFAGDQFDGVLCYAVLMHVPDESLFGSVYSLKRVLRPGGRLLVSVPARRAGIDQETRRDAKGRLFADLPPERLQLLLERVGFALLWQERTDDSLGRHDLFWSTMLFEKPVSGQARPLDTVEGILNRDNKVATYKLALFRALAELAQTSCHTGQFSPDGLVRVPTEAVAERWLGYYWPLFNAPEFVAQSNGETPTSAKPVAIRKPLVKLATAWDEHGGGLPAFKEALHRGALGQSLTRLHREAMSVLKRTIWNMPVRYAGGGEDFSILGYDRSTRCITIPTELWRELCLTGAWIRDATVLRWAELTERLSKGSIRASTAIDYLLMDADPERDVHAARTLYGELKAKHCVWSDALLGNDFDVDHALPFSLWRNNDLWNLLPTHPKTNNSKRDGIPTQRLLHRRRDAVLHYWGAMRQRYPRRFAREAMTLVSEPVASSGNWERPLFAAFCEAIETTAVQRGCNRWEPAG